MQFGVRQKQFVISASGAMGITGLSRHIQDMRLGSSYLRVVNYHGTPEPLRMNLERQFEYLAERYVSVGVEGLAAILSGRWAAERPGLIISFDDGLASNSSVAAPLLERYSLTGWFFLPVGIIEDCTQGRVQDERALASSRRVRLRPGEDRLERVFMTWDQVRQLAQHHVVGCHSMTHTRLGDDLDQATLHREIVAAKALMEARLGHSVDSFCWVGGEEASYSSDAATLIRKAGYRFSFMTNCHPVTPGADPFQLQRTNIEGDWPLAWLEFYLSGIMDTVRAFRRARVNRKTRSPVLT